jgi:hypothetical protein
MCISKQGNNVRLLVCNNDETVLLFVIQIKIFSVPELERIQTIQFPTAVNYASISPDGRKMIAVGDSPHVFMFNITSNGDYVKTATLNGICPCKLRSK